MGYDYIQTTEVKNVAKEKLITELTELVKLRCINSINITHVGDHHYDIEVKNTEHGVTF